MEATDELAVVIHGGCHCGKLQYLQKKQNLHFIVPDAAFKILKGEDNLTCYTFNLHKAKHLFCKSCGVQSFYKPRSNPNGYGIMPHCIDEDDAQRLKTNMKYFDGENWEEAIVVNKEILTKSNEPN